MADDTDTSGIVTRSLADVQRLLVCAYVVESDSVALTNDIKKGIKAIVGSTTPQSARVSLILKSNPAIRTGLEESSLQSRGKAAVS